MSSLDTIKFIEHKGKKILLIDFSQKTAEEVLELIPDVKNIVIKQPLNSLLTLIDVSNTHYNTTVIQTLKELTRANKPYVKASAVVGITAMLKIILQTVTRFSGRKFFTADNLVQGKDWLVEQ
jgi:hypothetical protein